MFGFLFLVFVILIIACSEVAIVMTYFQLCGEDYHWWWRSFLLSGSASFYVIAYSVLYYYTKVGPVSSWGYMCLGSNLVRPQCSVKLLSQVTCINHLGTCSYRWILRFSSALFIMSTVNWLLVYCVDIALPCPYDIYILYCLFSPCSWTSLSLCPLSCTSATAWSWCLDSGCLLELSDSMPHICSSVVYMLLWNKTNLLL